METGDFTDSFLIIFYIYTFIQRRVFYAEGRFGIHGGQYIPETLMNAVNELEESYEKFKKTRLFLKSWKIY